MMVVQNREIVPSAAKGRGVGGRLLYTNTNIDSAIFLRVWCHVSSCTAQRETLRGAFN